MTETHPNRLVPLSVLALELPEISSGYATFLADRNIAVVLDDVGRASVDRSDARRLLAERREQQEKANRRRVEVEQQAVERDRQFRARLHPGIPAGQIPDGVSPAMAMVAANESGRPRRTSPLEEALSGSGLTFHPIEEEDDRWVVGGGDG